MLKCIVLIVVVAATTGLEESSLLVNTFQGPVRGYKIPGGDVFAFYGIPYATAPIGVNKFKAPLPPPKWTSPLDATNANIICPQIQLLINLEGKIKQEDCLIANIYVPDTDEKDLPVLVSVHGGAYHLGYGDQMTAIQLIKKRNMIVVNFNYRLGVHGFLCLGTEDIPGNAGMKDQIALLRWVKSNIVGFGGNPDDVTLTGYSAGSSSVDLLLLSPMAKGLFNKVILESGASLNAFSVQSDPTKAAWDYAKMLNFTNTEDDISELENFYKTISFETMVSINIAQEFDSTFIFSPCVERNIGQEMFLDADPLTILKNNKHQKVPMLFGFSEMEGLFRIQLFNSWKEPMNAKFSDFLPGDLTFSSDEEKESVAKVIKEFYFGEEPVSEETVLRYVDYFTDIFFAYGTMRSAKYQIQSGNKEVYLYEYSFVDDNTPFVPHTEVRGADHCAQTMVVGDGIPSFQNNSTSDTEDLRKMKELMRELWINFILTGKPVPEDSVHPKWPSAKANGGPHMSLDRTIKLRGPLIQQRALFWDAIYEKYYRTPVPPAALWQRKSEL